MCYRYEHGDGWGFGNNTTIGFRGVFPLVAVQPIHQHPVSSLPREPPTTLIRRHDDGPKEWKRRDQDETSVTDTLDETDTETEVEKDSDETEDEDGEDRHRNVDGTGIEPNIQIVSKHPPPTLNRISIPPLPKHPLPESVEPSVRLNQLQTAHSLGYDTGDKLPPTPPISPLKTQPWNLDSGSGSAGSISRLASALPPTAGGGVGIGGASSSTGPSIEIPSTKSKSSSAHPTPIRVASYQHQQPRSPSALSPRTPKRTDSARVLRDDDDGEMDMDKGKERRQSLALDLWGAFGKG